MADQPPFEDSDIVDYLSIVIYDVNKKDPAESIDSGQLDNMFRLATAASSCCTGMW